MRSPLPRARLQASVLCREFACEVLFDDDIDGKSMATLLLDALLQAPIDLRRQLAENILVIGGTAMLPGFLHRLHAELLSLLDAPPYAYRLAIKEFQFHSPPAPLNYAAWLGGKTAVPIRMHALRTVLAHFD